MNVSTFLLVATTFFVELAAYFPGVMKLLELTRDKSFYVVSVATDPLALVIERND